jgi:hypothetical protein
MYCFRSTRIIELKRDYGTEVTKNMAGHAVGSSSHKRYDTTGVSDINIQGWCYGKESGISRNELSKQLRQANITAFVQHDEDFAGSLRQELDARIESRLREEGEYIEMAKGERSS